MKIEATAKNYALTRPFRIASRTYFDAPVVEVSIHQDGFVGRGEAAGVDHCGESCATMLAQIAQLAARLGASGVPDRDWLQSTMPPGGARNALDCAMWDLEAKRAGVTAYALAGQRGRETPTYITIGLDTADIMAKDARSFGADAFIKIKLGGDDDVSCLRAVRAAAPDAKLIVDANQGWTFEQLQKIEPELLACGVALVEQPLPVGDDARLLEYRGALRLCADESCHDRSDLEAIEGKYSFINIKLDKTGGLTEALALADAASARGLGLMVGCMGGSSLGIAPALVVAAQCAFVDLDCPLQLEQDIAEGLIYSGHRIEPLNPRLWG